MKGIRPMTRKHRGSIMGAALLFAAGTVYAGGWAVITVEDLPEHVSAGTPLTLTFTVRQHGKTPLDGLKGRVEAMAGDQTITAHATPGEQRGEYSAVLTFPRAADWVITIHSGFGSSRLTLLPLSVASVGTPVVSSPDIQRGQRLFVAKGCVTCHRLQAGVMANESLPIGPELIPNKYADAFLGRILEAPERTLPPRPDFYQMPNLHLQPHEITALVAFINAKTVAAR
jgi:cytochrome c